MADRIQGKTKSLFESIDLNLPKQCRVTITTANSSTYSGVLRSVDQVAGKITLTNVTTAGVKLFGPQIYYCKDMIDLQIISDLHDDRSGSKSPTKAKRTSMGMQHKKYQPAHLSKLINIDTDDLIMSNIFRDELGDQGIGSEEDDYEDFYECDGYFLICRVSEKFYDAIEYIMKQDTVGVQVDGQNLGRDGTCSLIQVATESDLIVFDMLRLGAEAFKEGLQAFFESDDVMKVIHDCRWVADFLKAQHNIAMNNIFDTQVANAFVFRIQNKGDWPRYVESLPGCLISYLNLHHSDVFFMKVRERSKEEDEAVWLYRPLPEKVLASAIKNTKYLLPLHRVLISEMLMEFKAGVKIYLNHVSGTVDDIRKCKMSSHLLPDAFSAIQKYVTSQSRRADWRDRNCYDQKGFLENNIQLTDNTVVFSHDSAWHKNKYCNKGFGRCEQMGQTRSKSKMASAPAEFRGKKDTASNATATQHLTSSDSIVNVQEESASHKLLLAERCVSPTDCQSQCSDNEHSSIHKESPRNVSCTNTTITSAQQSFYSSQDNTSTVSSRNTPASSTSENPQTSHNPLQNSKLWQALNRKKEHKPSVANVGSAVLAPERGQNISDLTEEEQLKEVQRRLAFFDQPAEFVSAKPQQSYSMKINKETVSSTVDQNPCCQKHFSASSDSESSSSFEAVMEAHLRKVKNANSVALMPAGMTTSTKSKRKSRQYSNWNTGKTTNNEDNSAANIGSDFSAIPAHGSLSRQIRAQPLGVSSIGIGDPFSEDEGFSTPGRAGLSSSRPTRLSMLSSDGVGAYADDAVSDDEINKLLESEKSQHILKLASSLQPSASVRSRLLPIPAKVMKSPKSGSTH